MNFEKESYDIFSSLIVCINNIFVHVFCLIIFTIISVTPVCTKCTNNKTCFLV